VPSDGNIIGDSSGTGSIILTGGAPKAAVIGINRNYSAGILGHVVIRNNVIGAIEAATNNDQNSTSIYCIRNNTFELIDDTISNNFIGSRTFANSIYASSLCLDGANAQNVYGVFNKGFGSTEISDNTISHLTNNAKFGISNLDGIYTDDGYIKACRNTISHLTNSCGNQNNSLVGINVSAAYGFTYLMGNHISNCRNTNPTESASTNGIFFASGFPGLIEKNFIHELYATSLNPASITRGIEITGFATTCQNNIISLQDATSGATVYGFYLTTGGHSIYYNTAHLSGNNGGNFDAAAALYGITPNFDVVIKNNIFANDKNGTGSHYAVYNHNFNTTHIEYNDYWGSTFNINPSPHSVFTNPEFSNPIGTNPIDYKPQADNLLADSIPSIDTDFFDLDRCFPTMGAIEVPTPPDATGPITGPVTVCPNDTGLIYTIPKVPYATSYTWTIPDAWSITANADTTITVTVGPVGSSGIITVLASNNCGPGIADTLVVAVVPSIPTFTVPDPISFCVRDIETASFYPDTMDITPERPDYYLFHPGDLDLDLDTSTFSDICCNNANFTIHWQIDFNGGTPASITETGQPSLYSSVIRFDGDGTTYTDVIHTIKYWLTNCTGNPSSIQTVNITIKPRPNIVKDP
jgi:hypothetical protein